MHLLKVHLEAFVENNGEANLLVFLLNDPYPLEGGWRGQDGAPIHAAYLRSGGVMLLIYIVLGARAMISFHILSVSQETWWPHQKAPCRSTVLHDGS